MQVHIPLAHLLCKLLCCSQQPLRKAPPTIPFLNRHVAQVGAVLSNCVHADTGHSATTHSSVRGGDQQQRNSYGTMPVARLLDNTLRTEGGLRVMYL